MWCGECQQNTHVYIFAVHTQCSGALVCRGALHVDPRQCMMMKCCLCGLERTFYPRFNPISERCIPCHINMLFTATYSVYMLHNTYMDMNMSIKHNYAVYMSVKIAFQQTCSLTNNIIFILHQLHNSHTGGGIAPDPPLLDGVF